MMYLHYYTVMIMSLYVVSEKSWHDFVLKLTNYMHVGQGIFTLIVVGYPERLLSVDLYDNISELLLLPY